MSTATRIYGFYAANPALVGRYRGGMPVGYFCSYAIHEGGGVMGTPVPGQDYTIGGDATLGEYGIFQVTRAAATNLGFDPSFRTTKEGNFFLGGLDANVNCALAANQYGLVPGSIDAWLFGFSWYAQGRGGTTSLWNAAGQPSTWQGMVDWVNDGGGFALGRVPVEKVQLRVRAVQTYWNDGVASGLPMVPAVPFLTPAPGDIGYSYIPDLDSEVQGLIGAGKLAPFGGIGDADANTAGGLVMLGVLAAVIGRAFT